MKSFIDPPASENLLNKLIDKIFIKNFKNVNSTLVSFRGAGRTSEIKYLSRYLDRISDYNNQLVTFFDLELLLLDEEKAYKEALNYLLDTYETKLDTEIVGEINLTLLLKPLKFDAFLHLIHYLTFKKDIKLMFFIDNFYKVYTSGKNGKILGETVASIKKTNPMKIVFTYVASYEFDESAVDNMGKLSTSFVENVVNGKDLPFDAESAECLLKNQEKWFDFKFTSAFKKRAIDLTANDPSVLKIIATKAISEPEFMNRLIDTVPIPELYELIGLQVLDQRYKKIVHSLFTDSLKYLIGQSEHVTDFLMQSGIVLDTKNIKAGSSKDSKHTPKNSHKKPFNELFAYYLVKNKDYVLSLINETGKPAANRVSVKQFLSGQELFVFQLFETKDGQVVTRDEVAHIMWGDTWETKYSDWAIDQLISRLRTRLEENDYPKILKSIKGKGFMLI